MNTIEIFGNAVRQFFLGIGSEPKRGSLLRMHSAREHSSKAFRGYIDKAEAAGLGYIVTCTEIKTQTQWGRLVEDGRRQVYEAVDSEIH